MRRRNRDEVRGNTVVVHGEIPPDASPPSTSMIPVLPKAPPPLPAAPRTALTADEQVRAAALDAAVRTTDICTHVHTEHATQADAIQAEASDVLAVADRYAAYIRGDNPR